MTGEDRPEEGDDKTERVRAGDEGGRPPRRRRRGSPDRRLEREAGDLRQFVRSLRAHDLEEAEDAFDDLKHELRGEILGSDSYVPVFIMTLFIVIAVPLSQENIIIQVPMVAFATGTILLTLRRSNIKATNLRRLSWIAILGGCLNVAANLIVNYSTRTPVWLAAITSLLFAFLIGISIPAMLRRVLLAKRVTVNMLAGALAAYLLLGLLFASVFRFVSLAHTEKPFFVQNSAPTASDFEYFSFITITTVGYGDLSPGNDLARAGAVCEAILGQVFMVTIVARVVSHLGTERVITIQQSEDGTVLRASRDGAPAPTEDSTDDSPGT